MKKYTSIFWIVGLCAFLAVICSGTNWVITKFDWSVPTLSKIAYYAGLVLTVSAYVIGLVWTMAIKNKTLRIICLVLYIAFVVLSFMGIMHLGL